MLALCPEYCQISNEYNGKVGRSNMLKGGHCEYVKPKRNHMTSNPLCLDDKSSPNTIK